MSKKIGVFGGTFDPPHLGHVALAEIARTQLDLDRLLWMLTPNPPHKKGREITAVQHRLAMVTLTLANLPECEISRIEIDRPGPHFALDTVRLVSKQFPGHLLVYLMGADSLSELPTWHRPDIFISVLSSIGVVQRTGITIDLDGLEKKLPGLRDILQFIDMPAVDISASDIRKRIKMGRSVEDSVLPSVFQYILTHKLYT